MPFARHLSPSNLTMSNTIIFRRRPLVLQALRSAAIFVALNPVHTASLVHTIKPISRSTSIANTAHRIRPSHPNSCGPSLRQPYSLRKFSSILLSSQSSSSSDVSTHGSVAVKSIRPTPTDTNESQEQFQLLSFYRFIPISQPESIRDNLFEILKEIQGLRGTVYVAKEGINAQFAVPVGDPLKQLMRAFSKKEDHEGEAAGCLPFDAFEKNPPNMGNVVDSNVPTFDRLVVRTRDCILRDGMLSREDENNGASTLDWSDSGMELDPSEWHAQLSPLLVDATSESSVNAQKKRIQLLDCRNTYESDQGTFRSSTPLNTQTFSETWSTLDSQVESQNLDPSEPVYIFCTGGIRCVKVGAYLKQKLGFDDVRSLRHGIIGYERWWNENEEDENTMGDNVGGSNTAADKEDVNVEMNKQDVKAPLWVGENFLFDKRRFAKKEEGDPSN